MHEKWMRRALELAQKGISGASPNPLVGCVLVKNDKIVGEGYHAKYGDAHAEINAIKNAGNNCHSASLYVNLEPCCHWGKTPPCTDAIVRAGIRTVFAAISDPNPAVKNKGFKKLKKSGIKVKVGVCKKEAQELNRAFIKTITQKEPYVILKSAFSLDGKIATRSGQSQWISSRASREFCWKLRTQMDAVLVGAETVRKDNPLLTSHECGRDPLRIVVSASGNLPRNAKIFDDSSKTCVFTSNASASKKDLPGTEWFLIKKKNTRIDFRTILRILAKKEISKLLIEGGGETTACALESGAVDELYFFIAPILIGGRDARTCFEGEGFKSLKQALKLTHVETRKIGEDWMFHARILHNY